MKNIESLKTPLLPAHMCERCYRIGSYVSIKRNHLKLAKRYFYECRFGCIK